MRKRVATAAQVGIGTETGIVPGRIWILTETGTETVIETETEIVQETERIVTETETGIVEVIEKEKGG